MSQDNDAIVQPLPDGIMKPLVGGSQNGLKLCGECRYSVSIGLDQPLQCHLEPPIPYPMPRQVRMPNGQQGMVVDTVTLWPGVGRSDVGCSKHDPKGTH